MRVAFSSSDGNTIDLHFGQAAHFYVWEVGPDSAELVERVSAIVYTVQIGGPAAAKLVARRIHPLKTGGELPVAEAVGKLQQVLRGRPPPWLRKALGLAAPEIPEATELTEEV